MSDSGRPTNSTIVGIALLLFGAPLAIVGLGHVIDIGTCSSSGFDSDTGARVPFCPRGTAFWILFLIGGIFVAIAGIGLLAARSAVVTRARAVVRTAPRLQPQPQPDVGQQLDKLTALHAQGALTDEELAAAKARLLM